MPQDPPQEELESIEGHLEYPTEPAATTTRPWLSVRQWMDGWMKVGPFHGFTDRKRDERRTGVNLSLHFDLKPVKFCGRNLHGYKNLSTDGHKHLATFSNSLQC